MAGKGGERKGVDLHQSMLGRLNTPAQEAELAGHAHEAFPAMAAPASLRFAKAEAVPEGRQRDGLGRELIGVRGMLSKPSREILRDTVREGECPESASTPKKRRRDVIHLLTGCELFLRSFSSDNDRMEPC